jgi:hypothetical protein
MCFKNLIEVERKLAARDHRGYTLVVFVIMVALYFSYIH